MSKKTPSAADTALFRQSIGAVKPVKTDRLLLQSNSKPLPYPKTRLKDSVEIFDQAALEDIITVSQEDTLSYLSPGLQKNTLRKLRQGHFGLDAELDLHGLTSQAAKEQLVTFLHHCVDQGCRSVHIIHGKGYRSVDNHPVLKNNLNQWLRQHQAVQAFCSAAQRHGGAGAVVVLLQLADKYRFEE